MTNAEAVNTQSAAEFAQAMAGQATAGVASLETLRTQLAGGGVEGQALALADTALDQMTRLADTFTELGGVLESHLVVGEAYAAVNNEAGNKDFNREVGTPAMSSNTAPPPAGQAAAERIRAAYDALLDRRQQDNPGATTCWVGLADLRDQLPDMPREEFDDALDAMIVDPNVDLMAELNQKAMTDRDRAAAASIGGEDRHLINFRDAEASVAERAHHLPSPLPDVLDVADGQECLGSNQIRGVGPAPTEIELRDEPANEYWAGGTYVQVATPQPGPPSPGGYTPPLLSPDEADQAAEHLEQLADLADSGYQPPMPTRIGRAAQLLDHLIDQDKAAPSDKIAVGDEEEFPLTVKELRKLLADADPGRGQSTRRTVTAQAAQQAGGDSGALWIDLEAQPGGGTLVTVVGTEGEAPSEGYESYTSRHTVGSARRLAGSLREFAAAGRHHTARPPASSTSGAGSAVATTAIDGSYEVTSGVWWSRERGTEAPYLDWSTTRPGGGRLVELSDGATALYIDLDAGQVADLAGELGGVLDDQVRDVGGLSVDDTRSVDIARTDNSAITLAFTEEGTTVSVPVPTDQLRSIRTQLLADSTNDAAGG